MSYEQLPLTDNASIHHFELNVDGHTAFIDYKLTPQKLFLIHTEVPAALEGKSVASAIVEKAFGFAEANNLKVVPLCTFIQTYLKRHKEWDRVIADDAGVHLSKHTKN